ncbi:MAG TPA: hypothetical protein VFD63_05010 [Pyrinomonadaceae bacterium]|nr:hypothetical protein [Pyrinomonadaceae bacterium]
MYLIGSMLGLIEGSNHPDCEKRTPIRDRNPTFEISFVSRPLSVVRRQCFEIKRRATDNGPWTTDQPVLDTLTG